MSEIFTAIGSLPLSWRLVVLASLAVVTHLVVILVRRFARRIFLGQPRRRYQKLRSIATLTTSALVFTLYFLAVGLILREFGVSLTAYLASASVVGLAIGFGSQGMVQDVVMGLTFIFSDLVDVGDLVEISGQTGIVKAITMRFVELENALGAMVFIPNRMIGNVINYPRGYVRCLVDTTLRGSETNREKIQVATLRQMQLLQKQFPGIMMIAPSSEGRVELDRDKEILRLKFRLWPNREKPIETAFNQELLATLVQIDPDFKPYMVAISYETAERVSNPAQAWPWRVAREQSAGAAPPS